MPKLIHMSDQMDITSLSVELNADPGSSPESVEETKTDAPIKEHKSIEELEEIVEKTDDHVPLKKFMEEKKARKEAEERAARAEQLAQEIEAERAHSRTRGTSNGTISDLAEKYDVSEEFIQDMLNVSYAVNREAIRKEIDEEYSPRLAEIDKIKSKEQQQQFDKQFNDLLNESLSDMPEFKDIIDKDDLKTWIKSGKYSKLTLPQLIEEKYGKFVAPGKKSLDSGYVQSREQNVPEPSNMTDQDWVNIENNPELKKKWQGSLEDRLRKYM